tara:strand:+ start:121 stop:885 length:765 start_codon:yes stop_codon:yes gene_type:complete
MRIVIPSYKRSSSINDKSLKTLYESGYLPDEIDLFVANKEEYDAYRAVVHSDVNIIVGCKGLKNIRNFIFNYYDEGTPLLCLDDDIEGLKVLDPSERLQNLTDFKDIVKQGFDLCEEHSLKLWGLFTCCNPRFMNNTKEITIDYKFIIGNFFGVINCRDMNQVNVNDIDDYERSIRSYQLYGGSVRLNHAAAKTKFLKNEGGAQEDANRFDTINESIEGLKDMYPDMFYLKKKKSGIGKTIILKKRTGLNVVPM